MATLRTYYLAGWLAVVAFSLVPLSEAVGKKPRTAKRAVPGRATLGRARLAKKLSQVRPSRDRPRPITLDETALRQAIYDTAAQFLGKTERTNHNDAPWITHINRFNHLPANAFYCASGLYYAYAKNGAWLNLRSVGYVSVYFRDPSKIVFRRGKRGNQRIGPPPKKMDFVSLYRSHIEGLADDRWDDDADYIMTIGFNTTGGSGTRGGCYLNRRRKDEVKLISNHLTPYLEQWKP